MWYKKDWNTYNIKKLNLVGIQEFFLYQEGILQLEIQLLRFSQLGFYR